MLACAVLMGIMASLIVLQQLITVLFTHDSFLENRERQEGRYMFFYFFFSDGGGGGGGGGGGQLVPLIWLCQFAANKRERERSTV